MNITPINKEITILDCTLRDGGFYNNWDFDLEKSKHMILSLKNAGVDIIEIGYKSLANGQFYGLFKYANERFLDYLKSVEGVEFAFMIDIKEFIDEKTTSINFDLLSQLVSKQQESVFQWVRLVSKLGHVPYAAKFIDFFKERGYKVCFNIMGGSLISDEELKATIHAVADTRLDVFYIADSYGSFYPEQVRAKVRLMKRHFPRQLGIHLHDNQGLAYANALVAIEEGIDFVDATLMGMGRGAGNLRLEQFLLGYNAIQKNKKYRPEELLASINDFIKPLHDKYQWGFNYAYMLSGIHNIHQTYCQNLSQTQRFTSGQITSILSAIPEKDRAKYKTDTLDNSIKKVLQSSLSTKEDSYSLPLLPLQKRTEQVLVIGGGPHAKKMQSSIKQFINTHQLSVIECNHTGLVDNISEKTIAILNRLKLHQYLSTAHEYDQIITGESFLPKEFAQKEHIFSVPFSMGTLNIKKEEINIPDYDVGMFAIALAIRNGAKEIYLAGFDGHEDATKNSYLNDFFAQLNEWEEDNAITIRSITPTKYQHLKQSSIYNTLLI